MTKKKPQTQPAPESSFNPGRWYRHNKSAVHRGLLYGIGVVVLFAIGWWAYFALSNREEKLTKDEYMTLARRAFNCGYFDVAILNYHKASNAAPEDQLVKREMFLARSRDNLNRGGGFELALASSYQVLADDPASIIGRVSLAQLFELRGQADSMLYYAGQALERGRATGDASAQLAADLVLATHHRTLDAQDSAFAYCEDALAAATALSDDFQVAFTKAGLGFAALQIDSLDYAQRVFRDLLAYRGRNGSDFNDIGSAGLADYFERRGARDSARVYLEPLRSSMDNNVIDGTTAYATRVYGRILRDEQKYDEAIEYLARSLEMWRNLRAIPDVIECLNDLAQVYRLKEDYLDARKYYMAAGNLANDQKLPRRDLYTADLNVLFLKNLKPDEYRRAGEEGIALARQLLVQ